MPKLSASKELTRSFLNLVSGLPPVYDMETGRLSTRELNAMEKEELRFLKDDGRISTGREVIILAVKGSEQWFECHPKEALERRRKVTTEKSLVAS